MAKRKNNNYKYKQQVEAEAAAKREQTFREKRHKTVVLVNILSVIAVIISVVMLFLYKDGIFPYADLVLLLVLAPTMWMQAYRYQTVSTKITKFCKIFAIVDIIFLVYNVYVKFFYKG